MTLQSEYSFLLPLGFRDASGTVHKQGVIRLATALDEIEALQEPLVQANEAYLPLTLLSRVVTSLGTLQDITPQVIGSLFAADLAYLEDLYLRLNSHNAVTLTAICPHCARQFDVQVAPLSQAEADSQAV